jgi:hypothetical protein
MLKTAPAFFKNILDEYNFGLTLEPMTYDVVWSAAYAELEECTHNTLAEFNDLVANNVNEVTSFKKRLLLDCLAWTIGHASWPITDRGNSAAAFYDDLKTYLEGIDSVVQIVYA